MDSTCLNSSQFSPKDRKLPYHPWKPAAPLSQEDGMRSSHHDKISTLPRWRRRANSPRWPLTGRPHLLLILDCGCCPVLVPCRRVCRKQWLPAMSLWTRPHPQLPPLPKFVELAPPHLRCPRRDCSPAACLASSNSMGSRVANLAITERSRHFTMANREKGMPYCFSNGTSWRRHVLSSTPTAASPTRYFTLTCSTVSSTQPCSPSNNNYIGLLIGRRRRCSPGPLSTFSRSAPPHVRCLYAPKPALYVIMGSHSRVLGPLHVRFRQLLRHYATPLT